MDTSICGYKWNGMELDRVMGTTHIDMYAKCESIDTARSVFDEVSNINRDVYAFSSLSCL